MSCEAMQERLDELAVERALDAPRADAVAAREHAQQCTACDAHLRFLRELDAALAAHAPEPVAPAVVARAQARAVRVLRARERPRAVWRDLVAALAVALLALPLVVAHAYVILEGGAWLLASWLPAPLLSWLGVAYLASVALAVGALYGMIPIAVAIRRRSAGETT